MFQANYKTHKTFICLPAILLFQVFLSSVLNIIYIVSRHTSQPQNSGLDFYLLYRPPKYTTD